jgi:hypothetical protein
MRKLVVLAMVGAIALAGIGAPAQAATSATFGPVVVTGVPANSLGVQKVVKLDQIDVDVAAGQVAYVYSTLRAYDSAHVNLIDNEVRCTGAGTTNVVLGENVDPAASPNPGRGDITIVNRFLVAAASSGRLTCAIYLRTKSLAEATSTVTVSGTLRFAATQVAGDANGQPMQISLPPGTTTVDPKVYAPILDRTIGPGFTKVTVVADMEYQSCYPTTCEHSSDTSGALFTLYVHQMAGDTICASAPVAQTSVVVSRQTHHKAVPLDTAVDLAPGCDRIYAYVRTDHTSGATGGIQGEAPGLTDETGGTGSGKHDSAMTHLFAIPG